MWTRKQRRLAIGFLLLILEETSDVRFFESGQLNRISVHAARKIARTVICAYAQLA
jgi:hypothetical protein